MATVYPGYFNKVVQQVFSASGTYTPTAGMIVCFAEAVGGAGAGGGATSTAGNSGAGGGGGGGEYAAGWFTAAQIGASKTVTIGTGGAFATAGNNPGNPGTATSLDALLIANGGSGGLGGPAGGPGSAGGAGGTGGTGTVLIDGQHGFTAVAQPIVTIYSQTGRGGDSHFGDGAQSVSFNGNSSGGFGLGVGGGGSGGGSWNGAGNVSGGSGQNGYMVITEYCSV
jgi:hypothetical protein